MYLNQLLIILLYLAAPNNRHQKTPQIHGQLMNNVGI